MECKNTVIVFLTLLSALHDVCVEGRKCGQTPCNPPGQCCDDNKNCCCTSSAGHYDMRCSSWSMPWWGILLIILALVAIAAGVAVAIFCYKRKQRQAFAQQCLQ